MDLRVKDKAFAIVGGNSGMGFAAARLLAEDGARVAIIARRREHGEARARELSEATGQRVAMFQADGAEPGAIDGALDRVVAEFGRLDGLAVTAGPMVAQRPIAELTDAEWDAFFQEHLMVTVRACRAAIPRIIASGGGTIVNLSAYSIRAQKSYLVGYTTMKSAIASITKNIAIAYGASGIRANTVCPGFIATEAAGKAMDAAARKYGLPPLEALNKALSADYGMHVALQRAGMPEEVGELIAFLLSPRAGYLTGALINCDGGTQF